MTLVVQEDVSAFERLQAAFDLKVFILGTDTLVLTQL